MRIVPTLMHLAWLGHAAWRMVTGRPIPVIGGLSITDVCNLDCTHCWRKNQGMGHVPFEDIGRALHRLHALGARYLYIQGGEPFTWQDGRHRVNDVVSQARSVGFYHIAVCTNGTYPFDVDSDSISLSVDGMSETHDRCRSGSYGRILANLAQSTHRNIFLNTTFHRVNHRELESLTRFAAQHPALQGLMVNFHIPYPGVEDLALSMTERSQVIARALELKRMGLPILNSSAGLRALQRNDWRRPLDVSVVTDCREWFSCCRARGNAPVCRQCGYAVWAELAEMSRGNPWAILEAARRLLR